MAKGRSGELEDRLERLLDVGIAALRDDGDVVAALLAIQETIKCAEALPKKPI